MSQEHIAGSFIIDKDGKKKENLKDNAMKDRAKKEKDKADKTIAAVPIEKKITLLLNEI